MSINEHFHLTTAPPDLDRVAAVARTRGTRVRRRRGALAAVAVVAACTAGAVAVQTTTGGGRQQLAAGPAASSTVPPFDDTTAVRAVEQALGVHLQGSSFAGPDGLVPVEHPDVQVSFLTQAGAVPSLFVCPAPGTTAEPGFDCAEEVLPDGTSLITYTRAHGVDDSDLARVVEAQVLRPDGWLVDLSVTNSWPLASGGSHRPTSGTLSLTLRQVREAVLALAPSYRP